MTFKLIFVGALLLLATACVAGPYQERTPYRGAYYGDPAYGGYYGNPGYGGYAGHPGYYRNGDPGP